MYRSGTAGKAELEELETQPHSRVTLVESGMSDSGDSTTPPSVRVGFALHHISCAESRYSDARCTRKESLLKKQNQLGYLGIYGHWS